MLESLNLSTTIKNKKLKNESQILREAIGFVEEEKVDFGGD